MSNKARAFNCRTADAHAAVFTVLRQFRELRLETSVDSSRSKAASLGVAATKRPDSRAVLQVKKRHDLGRGARIGFLRKVRW